ncbi:MAG TPA: glycosyltransferase [Caulobacteraceae bacterium]|jgi:cellulose synthase/poly-beta-1,6-N-acetylglucosamine synthase-like glycosyltransferase/peptidoglycan/xylan/chitin deacetylase (PgdA/CDA1 family)/spore germination protein YaaH|nr:glycosyltransferase [Caulobacteraceae bacterium]
MSNFVFHDPSGKRSRRTSWVFGLLTAVLFLLLAGFAMTLATSPSLPGVTFHSPRSLAAVHTEYHRTKEIPWLRELQKQQRKTAPVPAVKGKPLVVAFHVTDIGNSSRSLQQHINQIDVVAPQWLVLNSAKGDISVIPDPAARAILRTAKKKPAVVAVVMNLQSGVWQGDMASAMFANATARAAFINALVQQADDNGWAGICFDLEDMKPAGLALYPGFLAQAKAALNAHGRQVWATVPFDDLDWSPTKIAPHVDQLVLMAYDEHFRTGSPGAVAGQGWYEENLERLTKSLDPNKTIIGLGSYGYDWKGKESAETMTFQEATQAADDSSAPIVFDPDTLTPTFSFEENGLKHEVWFLDAITLFNEIQVTDSWRPHGYALWRLGTEDPGVWSVLGANYDDATTDNLHTLTAGSSVDFDGKGEILFVTGTPRPGRRDFTLDPNSDLVSNEQYAIVPQAYRVQRLGYDPDKKVVALTFDDGPDGRWTPKILDILKRYNVPATFFVIGQNMEHRPDLVMREVREGQEVGSHTFTHPNIGQVPLPEAALELNATQRLFETLTGRSLRLFRPPFLGDADPSTPNEVAPLLLAQKLNYVNVGLRIDPDDWQRPRWQDIIQRVEDQLEYPRNPEAPGRVVLLHDAGGDRQATVDALPGLIERLHDDGYTLVRVSDLVRMKNGATMTLEQAMPSANKNSGELLIDRSVFFLMRNFEEGLRIMLMTAIVLGVGRLLFLASFALAHVIKTARTKPPVLDPSQPHKVSVLIPCFNEERVIVASVTQILASDWKDLDVLVLDDGSTDRTAEVVEAAFKDEPRVRLMRFENGGKANALNRGLLAVTGEIVVALDADTQFPPQTIGRLARWFADPKVGAVAGNALVGNRTNLITRWQALEYVTAQNLERRALAVLGAVTVVPGAVGAWRRTALDAIGGYPSDTLAEDQDLTIAIQQAGWKVTFDSEARAFTESPDTVRGLLKQRFRWSFGTLQCLWKHRAGLFSRKNPALGFVALPQVWVFQIAMTVVSPLVDLAVIWSLLSAWMASQSHPVEWNSEDLVRAVAYWLAFILLDLAAGIVGMVMEPRAPWADLPWLPLQRFGYRQLMYYVVVKAVTNAVRGRRVLWGKLERKGTVAAPTRA